MESSIIAAVLGSSVITALITAYFTKRQDDRNDKNKYITDERKNWRTEIRQQSEKIAEKGRVSAVDVTFFEVRLNRLDPADLALLTTLRQIYSENLKLSENPDQFTNLINQISNLLKHDWERVKFETTFVHKFARTLFLTLIILSPFYFFQDEVAKGFATLDIEISLVAKVAKYLFYSSGIYLGIIVLLEAIQEFYLHQIRNHTDRLQWQSLWFIFGLIISTFIFLFISYAFTIPHCLRLFWILGCIAVAGIGMLLVSSREKGNNGIFRLIMVFFLKSLFGSLGKSLEIRRE